MALIYAHIFFTGLAKEIMANNNSTLQIRDTKNPENIDWNIVKYDPNTADTYEDAAWNCIVDFAEIEPRWACDMTVEIEQKYADMCTPNGNVQLMRKLVYPFCDLRRKSKVEKRPYLKKDAGPTTVVNVDLSINVDGEVATGDTMVTVTASGYPFVISIGADNNVKPEKGNVKAAAAQGEAALPSKPRERQVIATTSSTMAAAEDPLLAFSPAAMTPTQTAPPVTTFKSVLETASPGPSEQKLKKEMEANAEVGEGAE